MRTTTRHGGMSRWLATLLPAGLAMAWPIVAYCQDDAAHRAAMFDRPVATRKLPPKSDVDPVGEVLCTYYQDLEVQESGTDTPDPHAATLLPLPAGAPRPPCDTADHAQRITLATEGFSLLGRKGPFLLFGATDPNGAVPFMVIDAHGGHVLFTGGTSAGHGFYAIGLRNDVLRLRYTSGVNASCSLLQDPAGCWSKLLADGTLPAAMSHLAPQAGICAAAYKRDRAPADDPSVITYDIDMTLDTAGKTQVLSRGPVGCTPMP